MRKIKIIFLSRNFWSCSARRARPLATPLPLSNIFRGVFRKNELKSLTITGYPFCIISNESDFGTKGTHWVAIFFDVHGNCDYFDSYGQMPVPDIGRFIRQCAKGTYTIEWETTSKSWIGCVWTILYFLSFKTGPSSINEQYTPCFQRR